MALSKTTALPFGVDNKQNKIKLRGIASFKEHFTSHVEEDYNKDTELHLYTRDEIKLVRSGIPEDDSTMNCENIFLEGSPFMIALVLGEFEIAENILDLFPSVSISKLGELKWNSSGVLWNNFAFEKNSTIEILLYSNSCTIPKQLRNRILQRIVEEAEDLYSFSLKKVKGLKNPGVQKLLMEDFKNYPQLFAHNDCLYAHDIETLNLLLKIFQDDAQRNRLLINNTTGLNKKLSSDEKYDLTTDMKCIGSIVKTLIKCPNTYRNLYKYLLKIISQIQTRMMVEDSDINLWKKCKEYQEIVWKMFDFLPFDEEDFMALRECTESQFLMELLYELAEKKLEKKMPLYINPIYGCDLMILFGLGYEEEAMYKEFGLNFIFGNNTSNKVGKRLMRLLPFVSRIEYQKDDTSILDLQYLQNSLNSIITQHAEELKDVFSELLAKRFIPDECLDSVMSQANRVKKCAYMRPLLIMQKFGGIICDEG